MSIWDEYEQLKQDLSKLRALMSQAERTADSPMDRRLLRELGQEMDGKVDELEREFPKTMSQTESELKDIESEIEETEKEREQAEAELAKAEAQVERDEHERDAAPAKPKPVRINPSFGAGLRSELLDRFGDALPTEKAKPTMIPGADHETFFPGVD